MTTKTNWGFEVKKLRIQRGLTQEELADASGLNRSIISRIELGHLKTTNQFTFAGLAKGLGMTLDGLNEAITGKRLKSQTETPEQLLERLRLAQPISIPVYDNFPVHAGEGTEPMDFVFISRSRNVAKTVAAYPVHGTCLEPDIRDKDIIIVDRAAAIDQGDIVACLYQGQLHLGRLKMIGGESFIENGHGTFKVTDCPIAVKVIQIERRL